MNVNIFKNDVLSSFDTNAIFDEIDTNYIRVKTRFIDSNRDTLIDLSKHHDMTYDGIDEDGNMCFMC